MGAYRSFVFWGGETILLLSIFLLFVAIGWPGGPNNCLNVIHGVLTLKVGQYDQCYCEAYNFTKVVHHAPGVRQPVNTWFNLYAIFTSLIVATGLYFSRLKLDNGDVAPNVMSSNNAIADVYVYAVLFLGLGSMWFHASLTSGVAWMDGFSMYTYAAFLVFYTLRRHVHQDWVFWVFYPLTVIGFTVVGEIWQSPLPGLPTSLLLIVVLVLAYAGLEFKLGWVNGFKFGTAAPVFWFIGLISMGMAVFFWAMSQTGGFLCNPQSLFQPHGLLWHPLAGVMAVMMYFYWRVESSPDSVADV